MSHPKEKRKKRLRRRKRVRAKIYGTSGIPRLSVFRSNRHIYAQLIDDTAGRTLAAASDLGGGVSPRPSPKGSGRRSAKRHLTLGERAAEVGRAIASRATAQGIQHAVFDRGPFAYHGAVKALAEGARAGGLKF